MTETIERLRTALADRYLIDRELGVGGMATVYLAEDVRHHRKVAIKVMRPEIAAAMGGERFLREIAIAAPLQHPHILTLIDSGNAGGVLYYVMPWVEGESLATRLTRERQLPLPEALRFAREVADALHYAHSHGVVHRDIKPDNILITGGHAVVMDFGIARAMSGDGARLTGTGFAVGTPAYMSPEQAMGERDVDGRADIYALGCVLYEALAGEPPYTGPTPEAVIAKRLSEPIPRISVVRGTVGPALEAVIEKALARAPVDRYATAADFAAALEASAVPERRGRTDGRRTIIAAVGVAALAIVATLIWRGRSQPSMTPVTLRRFTSTGLANYPQFSPDGRRVAYVIANRALAVQPVDGGEPVVLVPSSRFIQEIHWTRDGTAILFQMFRDSLTLAGTWMVPSAGGAPRQVMDDQEAYDAGPDSTVALRYQRPGHVLELMDLATGRPRARFPLPESVTVAFAGGVAWSPDGRLAAVAGGGVWTFRLSDSTLHRVAAEGASPRWDASGRHLYFLAGPAGAVDLYRVRIDEAGAATGQAARILSVPRAQLFDVGPPGQLVIGEVSSALQARAASVASGRPPRLTDERELSTGSASVGQAVISDDGAVVAVARELSGSNLGPLQGRTSHRFVVELVPFGGGAARTVPPAGVSQFSPRWAPDGRRLTVLRSDSSGDFVTLVSIADGASRRLGTRPAVALFRAWGDAVWAADGSRVLYLASPRQLVIVDPERLTETTITIPDSIGTAFMGQVLSPHGDQLAVSTIRRLTDWGQLWLVDVATRRWRRAAEPFGNSYPLRWTSDGTIYVQSDRAVYSDAGNPTSDVWAVRQDGTPPRFVSPLPDGCLAASISADGRRVACVVSRQVNDLLLATDFAPAQR